MWTLQRPAVGSSDWLGPIIAAHNRKTFRSVNPALVILQRVLGQNSNSGAAPRTPLTVVVTMATCFAMSIQCFASPVAMLLRRIAAHIDLAVNFERFPTPRTLDPLDNEPGKISNSAEF